MSVQEHQQTSVMSPVSAPILQGENMTIEAQHFANGCNYTTNNVTRIEQHAIRIFEDENICFSKKKVVETARTLALAIEQGDTGVMRSIFDDTENSEIIETLTCELQADVKSNAIRFGGKQLNFSDLDLLLKPLSYIDKKRVIGHKGYDGLSAFHVAVETGNTDLVLKLMELQLADPKDPIPLKTQRNALQDTSTLPGDTAFDIAIKVKDYKSLFAMIKFTYRGPEAKAAIAAFEAAEAGTAAQAFAAAEALKGIADYEAAAVADALVVAEVVAATKIAAAAKAAAASKAVETAEAAAARAAAEVTTAVEVVEAVATIAAVETAEVIEVAAAVEDEAEVTEVLASSGIAEAVAAAESAKVAATIAAAQAIKDVKAAKDAEYVATEAAAEADKYLKTVEADVIKLAAAAAAAAKSADTAEASAALMVAEAADVTEAAAVAVRANA